MRALRLVARGAPLVLEELEDPAPAPGSAVVRVEAVGICRSDAHYRAGTPRLPPLPRTLGHEVAGVVVAVDAVDAAVVQVGDRVGVDYLTSCGRCGPCRSGAAPFCAQAAMIGKERDGGYAELIAVPVTNVVPLPGDVSFPHAAVMMCSTVTALHALRRARFGAGEVVAVFGLGGLGMSAVQLAHALGASKVYGIDPDPTKRDLAVRFGAVALPAEGDTSAAVRADGGADVALELVGSAATAEEAVRSLAPHGRAAMVGLAGEPMTLHTYDDLVAFEAEVVGVMDHTREELEEVLTMASQGAIDLTEVVNDTVPLDASTVNRALDHLQGPRRAIRTVITPHRS